MLELFMMETCPYCQKVMDYMDKSGIKYTKTDISNPDNVLKLLNFGGKEQVPFLMDTDNDKSLYESDDIIDYLKSLEG